MPAVLLAALIALGAKGVTVLGPKLIDLLAALISSAVNALLPAENEPKQLALEGLLDETTRVVSRLAQSTATGPEKAASALRILKFWNEENGKLFSTNQIEIVLKLVVERITGGK